MAEYVAEMSTRLVHNQTSQVSPTFRKFVNQILTSTRLPRTTILLGLNYLAKRINMLKASGNEQYANDGQIWRMLTIALLLGSKFLDDNTFQNRSWSEVSGLPVAELNTLENQWLAAIGWNLYVNLDHSKDYKAWLANYTEWLEDRKEKQQHRERLASIAPLDTDIRPRNSISHAWGQQTSDFERMSRAKQTSYGSQPSFRRDVWQTGQYPTQNPWHHPLTPPDSAYNTPEYVSSATSVTTARYNEWFAQAAAATTMPNAYQSSHSGYQSRTPASYHSYYSGSQHYGQSLYDTHSIMDCNCASCRPSKHQSYFLGHHNYGQPVAG